MGSDSLLGSVVPAQKQKSAGALPRAAVCGLVLRAQGANAGSSRREGVTTADALTGTW